MLIGQCTFDLKTSVTPDEERGIFQTPSAAASVGIVAGVAAAMVIVCLWMRCCHRGGGRGGDADDAKLRPDDLTHLSSDEISTLFKRLDEETRAQLSRNSQRLFSGMPCGPADVSDNVEAEKPMKQVEHPKKPESNKTSISSMAI